jgi:MFS family permease
MSESRPYPSSVYAWYVVVVLFLAYVVSFLDRQILSLLIEPIKRDLQISDTTISLLHGFAFAIFYTAFGIPIGRLADSRSRKAIIIAGVTLWSLMTSACGFAKNVTMLFAARIGVAVGEAALSPSAYSMISDYFPRQRRGLAMSLFSLGIFAGAGMAFLFGGLVAAWAAEAVAGSDGLLGQFRPWQLTFILCGLPGLVVAALMFTVREPLRRELYGSGGAVPLAEVFAFLRRYWRVYGSIIIGVAFVAMANYAYFTWLPAYFIRVYEYTPREIGLTFGTMLIGIGTPGLLLAGWMADFWYRRGGLGAHLALAAILSGVAIIPGVFLWFASTPREATVCIGVVVFFLAAHTGLIPASLQLITPNELRGQITALYQFLLNLIALGTGPTIVALLTDRYFQDPLAVGKSMVITLCGALAIGMTLFLLGLRAYIRRQKELAA